MSRDLEQFCGRVGFTSEDMKDFMLHLFPNREEVPDGVVAMPTPGSASGASGGSVARAATGTGSGAVGRPLAQVGSGRSGHTYTGTRTQAATPPTNPAPP